jgi:hypothetical protein
MGGLPERFVCNGDRRYRHPLAISPTRVLFLWDQKAGVPTDARHSKSRPSLLHIVGPRHGPLKG